MENENITLSKTQYESIITNTLSIGGYVPYNKILARNIGVLAAIVAGELINEYIYWKDNGGLTEDGYFYSTVENVENNTALTRYQQKPALDALMSIGVVDVARKGLPAKRYIKLDIAKLGAYLYDVEAPASTGKNHEQASGNTTRNNNNINIINNNIKESITLTSNTKEKKPAPDFETVINDLVCDEELKTVIHEFINMRKSSKYPLKTEYALKLAINKALKLANNNPLEAINIFNQSIVKGWADVYPVKDDNNGRNYQQPQKPFKSVFDNVVNPYATEESTADPSEFDLSPLPEEFIF